MVIGALATGLSLPVAAISATPEQGAEVGPSELGPQTITLFEAIRTGSLSAVQQAVLNGASLKARGPEGKTPAELVEFLEKYTITHFLRAYATIEQIDDSSRATEPAPEPVLAPVPAPVPSSVPEPGQSLPTVSLPVNDTPSQPQQLTPPPLKLWPLKSCWRPWTSSAVGSASSGTRTWTATCVSWSWPSSAVASRDRPAGQGLWRRMPLCDNGLGRRVRNRRDGIGG